MKSVKDFVMDDMWGHVIMTGPDIRGYFSGEKYPTAADKEGYCQGIFATYPHMMLANFARWMWPEGAPKDYEAFKAQSIPALQGKVFPVLAECFDESKPLPQPVRGEKLIPLLTDVIPRHVLTGFYDYMFAGTPEYKDISSFWPTVQPVLDLTARGLKAAYDDSDPMPVEEKTELFLFVGTRMAYLLLKRWYDWQFGAEKMEMGPPPGGPGGPGGPPPEGPGGPPPM